MNEHLTSAPAILFMDNFTLSNNISAETLYIGVMQRKRMDCSARFIHLIRLIIDTVVGPEVKPFLYTTEVLTAGSTIVFIKLLHVNLMKIQQQVTRYVFFILR